MVSFNSCRRFGVEIELNAFDGVDYRDRPLPVGKIPPGNAELACLLHRTTGKSVEIMTHTHNHNNKNWIVKPDASCGLEVCSPVTKGIAGINEVCKVVDAIKNTPAFNVDDRCSVHLHVEISDSSKQQVAAVLAYWVKCEQVFLDAMPSSRKMNRFCQSIGIMDVFRHSDPLDASSIIAALSDQKYYSANVRHYNNRVRNTIEFRIMDHEAVVNSFDMKNWIKLLIHFVEVTRMEKLPRDYSHRDQWSSFLWLDPIDVFKLLKFFDCLTEGMAQVRNWFLARMHQNITKNDDENKFVSRHLRAVARQQVDELIDYFKISEEELQLEPSHDKVYSPLWQN